jgi:hypothetical protein
MTADIKNIVRFKGPRPTPGTSHGGGAVVRSTYQGFPRVLSSTSTGTEARLIRRAAPWSPEP